MAGRANRNFEAAIGSDSALARGVNVWHGKITCQAVAEALDMAYTPLEACALGQDTSRLNPG